MIESCPLCSATEADTVSVTTREGQGIVRKCRSCRHVYLDPGEAVLDLEAFYADFYRQDLQRRPHIQNLDVYLAKLNADSERRFRTCRPYLSSDQTCLEVGAGYGLFAKAIRPFAKQVTVVDPSETTQTNAEQFGLLYVEDLALLKCRFDHIFAFHTLEHFIDPVAALDRLRLLLNDHGLLFIEVPNVNDLLVAASTKYQKFYYQLAHLHYFSSHTLERCFRKSAFDIVRKCSVQRYGLANHLKWLTAFEPSNLAGLDDVYRWLLGRSRWCDTLFYVVKPRIQ